METGEKDDAAGFLDEREAAGAGKLARRFQYPPFSYFNARIGWWQARKAYWLRQGIRSEMRRGADDARGGGGLTYNMPIVGYNKEKPKPPDQTTANQKSDALEISDYGTSHFDPVLCELIYSWACPKDGLIFDPFAGCSVSGMVAALSGYRFWGSDLCAAQVEANRRVLAGFPAVRGRVTWVVGDSAETLSSCPRADLFWSCPPYHDLEVYSKDPRDLSAMTWEGFRTAYARIISEGVKRLKDDRFAVIVIGDVRDQAGNFRALPDFTTECFLAAGMKLYNSAVLITPAATLSVRTTNQFFLSRKLGATFQEVLWYVKGDGKKATDAVSGMSIESRRKLLKDQARNRSRAASGVGWEDSDDGG